MPTLEITDAVHKTIVETLVTALEEAAYTPGRRNDVTLHYTTYAAARRALVAVDPDHAVLTLYKKGLR